MKVLRSLVAGVVLLALVAGIPLLVAVTIGNPLSAWPDLFGGDVSDRVVYGVLATVAWLAWAQFAVAVVVELVSGVRRSPMPRRLPGVFGFQQAGARTLVTAALMLGTVTFGAIAPAAMAVAAPVASQTVQPPTAAAAGAGGSAFESSIVSASPVQEAATRPPLLQSGAAPDAAPSGVGATASVRIVAGGPHTWWDLAETYLGSGKRWPQLWALNHGRPEPGGVRLSSPGVLRDDWTVLVPVDAVRAVAGRVGSARIATPAAAQQSSAAAVSSSVRPADAIGGPGAAEESSARLRTPAAVAAGADRGLTAGWRAEAPSTDSPAEAATSTNPVRVRVAPGDSLAVIATRHGMSWPTLFEANKGIQQADGGALVDPDELSVGWILTVPQPPEPASASPDPAGQDRLAVVRSGDTLSGIAAAQNVVLPDLWAANRGRAEPGGMRLTDPDLIEIGWTLTIPDNSTAPATATPTPTPQPSAPATTGQGSSTPDGSSPGPAPDDSVPVPPPGTTAPTTAPPTSDPPSAEKPGAGPAPTTIRSTTPKSTIAQGDTGTAATAVSSPGTTSAPMATRPDDQLAEPPSDATAAPAGADSSGSPAPMSSVAPTSHLPAVSRDSNLSAVTATDEAGSAVRGPAENHVTALAIGAGGLLLSGLAYAALRTGRRRQARWRRPGRAVAPTPPELIPMERTVLTKGASHYVDAERLDTALRSLAQELRREPGSRLPDVVAACITHESLRLVLAQPAGQDAPQPWVVEDDQLSWSLDWSVSLPPVDQETSCAPFPALVSVGYTSSGERWLLDLEMIGSLILSGDRERCLSLLRFVAAELANNIWSDRVRVTAVGLGDVMAGSDPDRFVSVPDLSSAVRRLQIQLNAVDEVATAARVDVSDGRLHHVAADTWAAEVVIVGPDAIGDRSALGEVIGRLRAARGRMAAAVTVQTLAGEPIGGATSPAHLMSALDPHPGVDGGRTDRTQPWTAAIDATGELELPLLGLRLIAEDLSAADARNLASLLALVRDTADAPAPANSNDTPATAVADAVGGLLPGVTGPEPVLRVAESSTEGAGRAGSVLPLPAAIYTSRAPVSARHLRQLAPVLTEQARLQLAAQSDPSLDDDLAQWWDENSTLPKVTVLGPVHVRAGGTLDERSPRRSWNVEVVTYLTLASHGFLPEVAGGATPERMGVDLWPSELNAHEKSKLRNAVLSARRWLGPNDRTGRDHVPTITGMSTGRYRVEDVLLDLSLFRRLRIRSQTKAAARTHEVSGASADRRAVSPEAGQEAISDLLEALRLVSGVPFSERRPGGYGWLVAGTDANVVAMVEDVAHVVSTHMLASDRPVEAMAAAQVGLRAGAGESLRSLMDCVASCQAQGLLAEGRTYINRMLAQAEGTVEEDLPPDIYEELRRRGWVS